MNYTSNSKTFINNIQIIKNSLPKKYLNNIIMGIGIYNQNYKSASKKVSLTLSNNFAGYSIFSYNVLKNDINYLNKFEKLIIRE